MQRKKKRKWLYWVGGLVLALILIICGVIYYAYSQLDNALETMHTPLERDPVRQKEVQETFKAKDPLNILLLGVDERAGDRGRSTQ